MGNGESSLWGLGERCECGTDVDCVGKIAEYLNYACRHLPFPKFFCTMFWNLCSLPIQNRAKGCASHTQSLLSTPFPVRFGRWHRFYTVTDLDPPCTTARYAVVPTLRNVGLRLCARVACATAVLCCCVCACACVCFLLLCGDFGNLFGM